MGRALASILAVASTLAADGDPLRYRLEVGQELVYTMTSEHRYQALLGLVKETIRWKAETRLLVVGVNADKSFRLYVRHTEKREDEEEPSVESGWLDLCPDGRSVPGPTVGNHFDAEGIFKLLPPGGATEWKATGSRGQRLRLRVGADGAIEETAESGQQALHGSTCTSRCVLGKAGIPERIETVWSKAKPADGRTETTTVLVGSTRTDASAAAMLGGDLASLAHALSAGLAARQLAGDEVSFVAAWKAKGAALLELRKQVKSTEIREDLDRWLGVDGAVPYPVLEEWRWFAPLRGKVAPDWTLEDLDGREHALADYRGKVVVLDFWFVDCFWCLRAMPALKELAARHAGEVVVLGMNKDASDKGVREVAEAMELTYPTLRARSVVGEYRVVGFPTAIVLDRKGVVRAAVSGFSPALGAELEATVAELLREPR